MFSARYLRNLPELKELIYQNVLTGEKEIAYLRLGVVLLVLFFVSLLVMTNHVLTVSDIANLSGSAIEITYTFILFYLIKKRKYKRYMGYISSSLDIFLISVSLYLSRFAPSSSLATITVAGAFSVYIPVILFSIRRQDPINCLYSGLLSAFLYLLVLFLMLKENIFQFEFVSTGGLSIRLNLINELIKASMLAVSGILAFVTSQNFDNLFLKGIKAQKEKEYFYGMFGKYLSNENVEQLLIQKIPLNGEKRLITILFVGFRNLAELSKKVEPELLLKVLNHFITYVSKHTQRHQGFIEKLFGGNIMVQFGAPVYIKNHREKAVSAAFDLIESSRELDRFVSDLDIDWKPLLSIGIDSGEVTLGSIGPVGRSEYAVFGDTIETADELEHQARDMGKELLVAENTYFPLLEELIDQKLTVNLKTNHAPSSVYLLKTPRRS